jgi:hypothetical protein
MADGGGMIFIFYGPGIYEVHTLGGSIGRRGLRAPGAGVTSLGAATSIGRSAVFGCEGRSSNSGARGQGEANRMNGLATAPVSAPTTLSRLGNSLRSCGADAASDL